MEIFNALERLCAKHERRVRSVGTLEILYHIVFVYTRRIF